MSIINATPLLAAAGGDYQISRSVRLRSSASAFFSRTPASAGNRKTWTWSAWVKRGSLSGAMHLFSSATSVSNQFVLQIASSGALEIADYRGGVTQASKISTALHRDPSAWYHFVLVTDTTQATAEDRFRIFVNGVRLTAFSTNTVNTLQNADLDLNQASTAHRIGESFFGGAPFDGYLTEINFIDGQALTPSSFGENDAITGVWKPKKYAGTYGTNGFYLNFSDNSAATAATIGKDYSGNGNNWTPNNISVTAGATYDSMLDVPTLYADGGNGRGNYAVLNPLKNGGTAPSSANLNVTSAVNNALCLATVGMTSGKYYWEFVQSVSGSGSICGISQDNVNLNSYLGATANGWGYHQTGLTYTNGVSSSYGNTWTTNDVIGIAFDADTGKLYFSKNGTWQNSGNPETGTNPAYSGLVTSPYFPTIQANNGATGIINFGQRPFAYTPPTGFKALNTQNLPEPTIKKGNQYFDVSTYTGNGTSQSIVNSGSMQPDFVWVKTRSAATNHLLADSSRGVNNLLLSNSTQAEVNIASSITAFNANGFSVGSYSEANNNTATFVGWQWKEGPSAGFDIVTFNSPASGAFTVNHNLGVAPKMIITKERDGTLSWLTYHASVNSKDDYMMLNSTAAKSGVAVGAWGAALPTSTQFGMTVGVSVNASKQVVAYLFAEVAGFSKFGSYTGNGSADGPFVFCGFRPRWVMVKRTDTTANWGIADTARSPINAGDQWLFANLSDAEYAGTLGANIDVLSNGFKLRIAGGAGFNTNGGTYIFAAFAESPFKTSLAR